MLSTGSGQILISYFKRKIVPMSYSIYKEPMKLREYGRNVQMMVDYCRTLTDREERTVLSNEIIRIMSYMIPTPREGEDFQQKLWDHFYHLAQYDIDIDSAYPMPAPDSIFTRPKERMSYQMRKSRFRQYGLCIEFMAEAAIAMVDDEDRKHALVTLILNIMKMHLRGGSNEKDSNAEATACEHLRILSKGKLEYAPEGIKFHKFAAVPAMGLPGMPPMAQKSGQQQMQKKKPNQMPQNIYNQNFNKNRR